MKERNDIRGSRIFLSMIILMGVFAFLVLPLSGMGQLGAPIVNITFGDSLPDPGPPLPAGQTPFRFSKDTCPPAGTYTITNSLYHCPATRMGRSIDNTPGSRNGYMMLVNDTVSRNSRILFVDTLNEPLCPGSSYQFSAYFLNVEIPGYCGTTNLHFPQFSLRVETVSGQVLASGDTGPLPYAYNLVRTPKFTPFAINFTMPSGINSLVLKIVDDSSGYSPCGYEYAIDDIQFMAAGPTAEIAFSDDVFGGNERVKEVCFQDSVPIALKGRIDTPGFVSPAVQWQQSLDGGITWTDIAAEMQLNYSHTYTVPDTFLIRMRASEASRIGNPNCSVVSNTRQIIVDGLPGDYTLSSNSPVCAGSMLKFNVTGSIAGVIWTGPNGFYDDVGYASIYHTVLADSGTYYARIISTGGCRKTDSLRVKILGIANPTVNPPDSICRGTSVQLRAAGGISYEWSPARGLSHTSIADPIASPQSTTVYSVIIQGESGCTDSLSVRVTVKNMVPVKAQFMESGYICRPLDSVLFKDASTGIIRMWNWRFGNGGGSDLESPPMQYYQIGAQSFFDTVTLKVVDTAGCADSMSHILTVEDNCYIAVPNAFSPNGDGINDYLYPLDAYKAQDLRFLVFNRYGQLVFQTSDWTQKWDGTQNGQPLPADVYVWTLVYRDQSGHWLHLKGYTLLIR